LRTAGPCRWRSCGFSRRVGAAKISRTTVINILQENKLDPRTDPAKGTWGGHPSVSYLACRSREIAFTVQG
jgi:hypothetical protein